LRSYQKLYKKDFPFTERTLHYLRITLIVKNVGSALWAEKEG